MKIILTKYFKEKYLPKKLQLSDMVTLMLLIKEKQHKYIDFRDDFCKLKIKSGGVSLRFVLKILEDSYIIPIICVQKKNKKFGENISWKQDKEFILGEYEKIIMDVEAGEHEII